jgi:hypothetical protein
MPESPSPPPFSTAALRIVDVLRPHTPFAEAIVRRQAERAGYDASTVTTAVLPKIIPLVISASQAFVDPSVIQALKALLT